MERTIIYWVWELNRDGNENPEGLFGHDYYGANIVEARAAVSRLRMEGKSVQMNTTITEIWKAEEF